MSNTAENITIGRINQQIDQHLELARLGLRTFIRNTIAGDPPLGLSDLQNALDSITTIQGLAQARDM